MWYVRRSVKKSKTFRTNSRGEGRDMARYWLGEYVNTSQAPSIAFSSYRDLWFHLSEKYQQDVFVYYYFFQTIFPPYTAQIIKALYIIVYLSAVP